MGKYWRTTSSGKRVRTKAGYEREYELYGGTAKYKAERAARNNARRAAIRKGKAHKGDGTDVHHSKGINSDKGLVVMSSSKNRGIHEKSRKRGSKRARYGDKRR